MSFFKKLFCKHKWVITYYGETHLETCIWEFQWKECKKCGKTKKEYA